MKVKSPRTAAQLEGLITEYINRKGGCVTKVSSTGRPIVSQNTVKDVTGRKRVIKDVKYIPGTTRKGTADILGAYNGKAIAIEVKYSRGDRLSDEQKQFRDDWIRAGGLHYVIKTFEELVEMI